MKRLEWQDAPKAERIVICQHYLTKHPECSATVADLDFAWTGCWFDVIKFTFGPASWR